MSRTVEFFIPGQICEKCEKEIGKENYVLIQDNIRRDLHKFHAACAPKDPDVRRHHGLTAEPGSLGWTLKGFQ